MKKVTYVAQRGRATQHTIEVYANANEEYGFFIDGKQFEALACVSLGSHTQADIWMIVSITDDNCYDKVLFTEFCAEESVLADFEDILDGNDPMFPEIFDDILDAVIKADETHHYLADLNV